MPRKPCFFLTAAGDFNFLCGALAIISLQALTGVFISVDTGQIKSSPDPIVQLWPIRPGGLPPTLNGPQPPPSCTGGIWRAPFLPHPQEQHPRLGVLLLCTPFIPPENSVILLFGQGLISLVQPLRKERILERRGEARMGGPPRD